MSNEQIAVVTGAGSGIGRAIARELAARGITVVVTDLDPALAEAVAAELGTWSRPLDVTDAGQATETAQAVVRAARGARRMGLECRASRRWPGSST